MAILGKSEPTDCPKCGQPWLGTAKCECGWRANSKMFYARIALGCTVVAAACATCWLVPRFYDVFPDNRAADEYLTKARDLMQQGNVKDAVDEFKMAVRYSPNRADAHREAARALFADRRLHEATQEMALAHRLDNKNEEIATEYVALLDRTGDAQQAVKVYSATFGENPAEPERKRKLAELCVGAGANARAEALYTEIIKARPKEGNIQYLVLADMQEKRKDRKAAIATLRNGLSYLPGDAYLQQALGTVLMADGQKEEAIKAFTRATELEPRLAQKNSELIGTLKRSPDKQTVYVIPLRREGNSYIAKVRINDAIDADMVVDTGATGVAISQDIARKLNVTDMSGQPTVVAGATGIALTRRIVLQSVQVGDARESLVDASVLPTKHFLEDGLLGMTFLSRYQFSMDLKKNVLVLKQR